LDPKVGDIHLPVDLIRTIAIVLVILLHAAIEPHPIVTTQITQAEVYRWWTVNIYNSLARPCIPLFIMLSGALLLQPSKLKEPTRAFFKKRLNRIALPFIFWGAAYFAWRFFVNQEALSLNSIVQGILTGPYFHFWFLYLLIGLYLITPILRVIVGYADWKVLRYFFLIWFLGTAIVPLLGLLSTYSLNANAFVLTGWLGYFLLGAYLTKIKIRSSILYITMFTGFAWTIIGTYIITAAIGGSLSLFFYDYLSANVILASVGLFLLLLTISPRHFENSSSKAYRLLHQISKNTLPIYLFHVIILESLQKGYFGFKISVTTMNPALEIPLITAITFFVCLGLIYLLKKIPYLRRLIG
jgi:surface polysaccharide O-acyltransferase-like enzyme